MRLKSDFVLPWPLEMAYGVKFSIGDSSIDYSKVSVRQLKEKGITKEYLFPEFSKICEKIKNDIYSQFGF